MFFRKLWMFIALSLISSCLNAAPIGTAFSYQGDLKVSGVPANGAFDFEFALFDVANGSTSLSNVDLGSVNVANGLFTVQLDYTDVPFIAAQAYFLEVRVRNTGDSGAYTALLPRQPITATPYAINALSVQPSGVNQNAIASGAVGSNQLADGAVTTTKIADGSISSNKLSFAPGTVSSIVAGNGLVGGGNGPTVALDVGAGTGIIVDADHVAIDTSFTDGRYRGKTCPAGYISNGGSLCTEALDGAGFTFAGCASRCSTARTHMCRSSEVRTIIAQSFPTSDNLLLDWIDDQDAVGSALYVTNAASAESPEATRPTSTSSYCRCCASLE